MTSPAGRSRRTTRRPCATRSCPRCRPRWRTRTSPSRCGPARWCAPRPSRDSASREPPTSRSSGPRAAGRGAMPRPDRLASRAAVPGRPTGRVPGRAAEQRSAGTDAAPPAGARARRSCTSPPRIGGAERSGGQEREQERARRKAQDEAMAALERAEDAATAATRTENGTCARGSGTGGRALRGATGARRGARGGEAHCRRATGGTAHRGSPGLSRLGDPTKTPDAQ